MSSPPSLTDELKHTIQGAYSQFLDNRGLQPRHGQKLMIANIAKTLANIPLDDDNKRVEGEQSHLCVVEAGTGTGKTIAYLLAALPIAKALNKKVVIATATVALQEQIIHKDLPEVKKQTDLSFSMSLAKGRGRYLCLSKLDRLLMAAESPDDFMVPVPDGSEQGVQSIDEQVLTVYNSMVDALAAGKWDGDRDNWPTELCETVWRPVTTNHRECTGRSCSNVSTCRFFKARDTIERYDCVVANHNLVLADLALGGGAILPDPSDSIYIFDEGHHLPEKAIGHFAYHTRLSATSKWLEQSHKTLSSLLGDVSGAGRIDHYAEQLPSLLLEAKQSLDQLYPQCQPLIEEALQERENSRYGQHDSVRYRFQQGIPADAIIDIAEQLAAQFGRLSKLLNHIATEMQHGMEDRFCDVPKADLETWFPVVGHWQTRAEANVALWQSYAEARVEKAHQDSTRLPQARWITLVEFSGVNDFEVCCSPVLAANTLRRCLWDTCFGAVVTSATLTALGSFERFKLRSGITSEQHFSVMPSPFDFSQALLQVPAYAVEANQSLRHTEMLVERLPALCKEEKGTLVLFASRRQMEEVHEQLPLSLRRCVVIQGEHSKQAMLTTHKARIDNRESSVLFGLASFAEGVDLPGDYCRHVIMAKLPFAVPDDPVEASLAEWVESRGGNAFMEITVPDAAVKLVQACGRLLRAETDTGTITLLDRRLVSKRYGKLLLKSLPAYRFSEGR